MTSFMSEAEVGALGLAGFGQRVLISRFARFYNPSRISIGSNVRIDDFSILCGGSGITIGSNIHIAPFCALYGAAGIEMRDFSGLSCRVTLHSESDDYSGETMTNPTVPAAFKAKMKTGKITLGRHAIVGSGSTVMPGVQIGEGAAVGAHSFVARSCEEWTINFGCPTQIIGKRSRRILDLEKEFSECAS